MTALETEDIKKQWRTAGIALLAAVTTVLVAFSGTTVRLVTTWWDKPEYNHSLLILPILGYLIYERREIFKRIAPEPGWLGLLPLLGGGVIWLLGDLADANVVREFGLVVLIQGCILTILGKRVVHAFIFPFLYMIFLIPFGDFLVPILQDFTTWFVVGILHLLNIPVFVEGVYISIPAGDFYVAEACAGLRFLVATVALGTLMANVAYKTVGRQLIVVALSFVVPIIANGFRAAGIILIAHWSDMKYATGADHITFGWIFFAIVLLIFISISMTFTNRGINDGYIDFSKKYWTKNKPVAAKYFALFFLVTIIIAGTAPIYASMIEQRYQTFEGYSLKSDEGLLGVDVSEKIDWEPYYDGASQVIRKQNVQGPLDTIDIFIAYYKYQSKDAEMIQYGNGVVPQEVWGRISSRVISPEDTGLDGPVNEVLIQSGMNRRLVWYWYWVDGKIVANNYKAKLLDAKAKLTGGRLDSAVIALSLTYDDNNIDQKRKKLSSFAAGLPHFETIVTTSK
ncbi:Eight transmembrane protein EpsH / EpsI protein [hydrothermal vent metagenome]|uniref:Eight transmembrane protein EpsH / EpsI protein n=1 Tax=hydrothermal vent metagenome TaxID=652676 RepID=A0A3B0R355_9ZZZZ